MAQERMKNFDSEEVIPIALDFIKKAKDAHGHLMQKVSWLVQPMGQLMAAHLKSLAEYPPVQGGKSFDMSNVVEDFINKGMQ